MKKQKVSVPVFVGGLHYSWRQLREEEVGNRLKQYIEKGVKEGNVDVSVEVINRKHAVVRLAGSRKAACAAALEILSSDRNGRRIDDKIGFAEIKAHNDFELSELRIGASKEEIDDLIPEEREGPRPLVHIKRLVPQRLKYPNEVWASALDQVNAERSIQAYARPLMHKLQSQCLHQVETERSATQADWRAWGIDLPAAKGAPKKYLAATVRAFEKAYFSLNKEHRHCYEIIEASKPCYPYFDLEENHCLEDRSPQADIVANCTFEILRQVLPMAATIQAHVIVLDSSRPDKFSQHLIVRTLRNGKEAPLEKGLEAAKYIATLVKSRLHSLGLHTAATLIDDSVYTKNRCFRVLGSSKLAEKQTTKLPAFRFLKSIVYTDGKSPQITHSPEPSFSDTLIVPVHMNAGTNCLALHSVNSLFTLDPAAKQQAKNKAILTTTTTLNNDTSSPGHPRQQPIPVLLPLMTDNSKEHWTSRWRGATARPLLDLINLSHPFIRCSSKGQGSPPKPFTQLAAKAIDIARIALPDSSSAQVQLWYYKAAEHPSERYLHLVLRNTRFCHARGRQHKSQNTIITVEPCTGELWQRCFDFADCSIHAQTKDGTTVSLHAKFSLRYNVPSEYRPDLDELVDYELANELAYHQRQEEKLNVSSHDNSRNLLTCFGQNSSASILPQPEYVLQQPAFGISSGLPLGELDTEIISLPSSATTQPPRLLHQERVEDFSEEKAHEDI